MAESKPQRLLSLDVMRGITIACMILVNTPGSWSYLYAPLSHAAWNGLTPTDLIFPFFLFMVGLAMTFGLPKMQALPRKTALFNLAKRGLLLFVIGYVIHMLPALISQGSQWSFASSRIPGVLQRIGIAYTLVGILLLYLNPKQVFYTAIGILLSYWGILYLAPDPLTLEGNLIRTIDIAIFGETHIWAMQGAAGRVPFDPEGLLSTLPAVVTVLIGVWSGWILRSSDDIYKKLTHLGIYGSILGIIGVFWGFGFPINKALWSSTYVLATGGIAMMFLALLTWIIDLKGYKKWTLPFVVYGSNALFAYCLAEFWVGAMWTFVKVPDGHGNWVVAYAGIFNRWLEPTFGSYPGSLLFAIIHVVFIWAILVPLYRKKIFIKI